MAGQVFLQVLNGFVWGWILALISLGLSLIFGLLQIINIAHGTLYMLGAVFSWYLLQWTGSFWVTLIGAPLLVGLLGMVLERTLLRPVEKNPVMTIIATFALLLIFQQTVLLTFGGSARRIPEPFGFQVSLGQFGYSGYRLVVAGIAVVVLAGVWIFLHKTRAGTLDPRGETRQGNGPGAGNSGFDGVYPDLRAGGLPGRAERGAGRADRRGRFPHGHRHHHLGLYRRHHRGGREPKGVGDLSPPGRASSSEFASIFLAPTMAQVVALLVMAVILLFRPPWPLPGGLMSGSPPGSQDGPHPSQAQQGHRGQEGFSRDPRGRVSDPLSFCLPPWACSGRPC